jgi:hypothetical protein
LRGAKKPNLHKDMEVMVDLMEDQAGHGFTCSQQRSQGHSFFLSAPDIVPFMSDGVLYYSQKQPLMPKKLFLPFTVDNIFYQE